MEVLVYAAPAAGFASLFVAFAISSWISRRNEGDEAARKISSDIKKSMKVFLKTQYLTLAVAAVPVFLAIGIILRDWMTAANFLFGAGFCMIAGHFGVKSAAKSADKAAASAAEGGKYLVMKVAFRGGAAMGICAVGLGLFAIGMAFVIFGVDKISVTVGFCLGACFAAVFSRIPGGVFADSATACVDLAERDSTDMIGSNGNNPAVIADKAGNYIANVAGMGFETFEAYAGALAVSFILSVMQGIDPLGGVIFPLGLATMGIVSTIIITLYIRCSDKTNTARILNAGIYIGGFVVALFSLFLSNLVFNTLLPACAAIIGWLAGIMIPKMTEVYTSCDYFYVKKIANRFDLSPDMAILSSLGTGMRSVMWPMLFIMACILGANICSGLYGVALAAVGMLSSAGMIISVSAYCAVIKNSASIARMSDMPERAADVTGNLSLAGNTVASSYKGYAVGTAAICSLAFFALYANVTGLDKIDLLNPQTVAGGLIGMALPFLFAALIIEDVDKASLLLLQEVSRRTSSWQEDQQNEVWEDHAGYSRIVTKLSLKSMIIPVTVAAITPFIVGFCLGSEALGGTICGSVISGMFVSFAMTNAKSAMNNAQNNAKSDMPKGIFKDSCSSGINVLIKFMVIVSVVFAPVFLAAGSIWDRVM